MSRQLELYELGHETRFELRQPDRNFIHCFGCGEIVAEDETEGGFCKECMKFEEARS
jgi:hypothetical protein